MSIELSEGPLSWEELLEACHVQFAAFEGFDLDQWLRRREDPTEQDVIDSAREKSRLQADQKYKLLVARIDGKIVGYTVWMVPKRCRPAPTISHTLWEYALSFQDKVSDFFFSRHPRMDPDRLKIFKNAQKESMKRIMKDDEDRWWYLCILIIHPNYQRKGIGGKMLQWGLRQAKETGERAYLESSLAGDALYIKHGFTQNGSITIGGPKAGGGKEVYLKCFVYG